MAFPSNQGSRSRSGRVIEQLGTLLLAVVLAIIVWLIAINQEDPIVQDEYAERIPVAVRGLAEDLQPLQDLSTTTVRAVLRAPLSSWDDLDVDDFNAYIDLAGLNAGVHDVEVHLEVVDPSVDIMSITRPQLRVQLDDVIQKEVPVRVEVMDSTAFGYDWNLPIVEPITVTVSGPKTQVDQVAVARAEIFLRNAKNQVERVQALTPVDAQGQTVERISLSPPDARIVVPVEEWPGRKEVAVRVSMNGQPAPGYRLTSVRVNPSTVVLLGAAETLSSVPGFVETQPISLANATGEIQQRLTLIIPEDVTVLEGETVDVTVSITPIEGGTTVRQEPVIQGTAPGLQASVALDTVEVILSGPLPLLESLGADDVFVILDLSGLLPGVHTVAPKVVVPDEIRAEGVIPEQVEVVISDNTPDQDTSDGSTSPIDATSTAITTSAVSPTLSTTSVVDTPVVATPEITTPETGTPVPATSAASEIEASTEGTPTLSAVTGTLTSAGSDSLVLTPLSTVFGTRTATVSPVPTTPIATASATALAAPVRSTSTSTPIRGTVTSEATRAP